MLLRYYIIQYIYDFFSGIDFSIIRFLEIWHNSKQQYSGYRHTFWFWNNKMFEMIVHLPPCYVCTYSKQFIKIHREIWWWPLYFVDSKRFCLLYMCCAKSKDKRERSAPYWQESSVQFCIQLFFYTCKIYNLWDQIYLKARRQEGDD